MAPEQVPPNNFPNTLVNCAIRQYARGMTTSPDPRVEAAADALAKHDGWISLSHPSPATQKKIRARADAFLASVDAVDPLRKPHTVTPPEQWDGWSIPQRVAIGIDPVNVPSEPEA